MKSVAGIGVHASDGAGNSHRAAPQVRADSRRGGVAPGRGRGVQGDDLEVGRVVGKQAREGRAVGTRPRRARRATLFHAQRLQPRTAATIGRASAWAARRTRPVALRAGPAAGPRRRSDRGVDDVRAAAPAAAGLETDLLEVLGLAEVEP